ncbi:hypothetical protein GCM10010431_34850 [Streptomyces kunmingensis]
MLDTLPDRGGVRAVEEPRVLGVGALHLDPDLFDEGRQFRPHHRGELRWQRAQRLVHIKVLYAVRHCAVLAVRAPGGGDRRAREPWGRLPRGIRQVRTFGIS